MTDGESATASHARTGPAALRVPLVGRLAVSALIWFILTFAAGVIGLSPPGLFGLLGLVVLELLYWAFKWKRRHRQMEQAVSLQAELHALKQQEFELRYKAAQQDGSLKRFRQKEPNA